MKLSSLLPANQVRCFSLSRRAAHTMVEMMISVAVFSLIIIGVLACNLAGLRFNQFITPKLRNAQYSRQTLSSLLEEIRAANSIQIGTGTLSSFIVAGPTNLQAGNALRIYPSTNTARFIYFFHDAASSAVQEISLSSTGAVTLASAVTNHTIFTMEDYAGHVLTNNQNNAVVGVLLQMDRNSAWHGISDATTVHTKVTRRNLL